MKRTLANNVPSKNSAWTSFGSSAKNAAAAHFGMDAKKVGSGHITKMLSDFTGGTVTYKQPCSLWKMHTRATQQNLLQEAIPITQLIRAGFTENDWRLLQQQYKFCCVTGYEVNYEGTSIFQLPQMNNSTSLVIPFEFGYEPGNSLLRLPINSLEMKGLMNSQTVDWKATSVMITGTVTQPPRKKFPQQKQSKEWIRLSDIRDYKIGNWWQVNQHQDQMGNNFDQLDVVQGNNFNPFIEANWPQDPNTISDNRLLDSGYKLFEPNNDARANVVQDQSLFNLVENRPIPMNMNNYKEYGNLQGIHPIQRDLVKQLGVLHFRCSNTGFRGLCPGRFLIKLHVYFTGEFVHTKELPVNTHMTRVQQIQRQRAVPNNMTNKPIPLWYNNSVLEDAKIESYPIQCLNYFLHTYMKSQSRPMMSEMNPQLRAEIRQVLSNAHNAAETWRNNLAIAQANNQQAPPPPGFDPMVQMAIVDTLIFISNRQNVINAETTNILNKQKIASPSISLTSIQENPRDQFYVQNELHQRHGSLLQALSFQEKIKMTDYLSNKFLPC